MKRAWRRPRRTRRARQRRSISQPGGCRRQRLPRESHPATSSTLKGLKSRRLAPASDPRRRVGLPLRACSAAPGATRLPETASAAITVASASHCDLNETAPLKTALGPPGHLAEAADQIAAAASTASKGRCRWTRMRGAPFSRCSASAACSTSPKSRPPATPRPRRARRCSITSRPSSASSRAAWKRGRSSSARWRGAISGASARASISSRTRMPSRSGTACASALRRTAAGASFTRSSRASCSPSCRRSS